MIICGCSYDGITMSLHDHSKYLPAELIAPRIVTALGHLLVPDAARESSAGALGAICRLLALDVKHNATANKLSDRDLAEITAACPLTGQLAALLIRWRQYDCLLEKINKILSETRPSYRTLMDLAPTLLVMRENHEALPQNALADILRRVLPCVTSAFEQAKQQGRAVDAINSLGWGCLFAIGNDLNMANRLVDGVTLNAVPVHYHAWYLALKFYVRKEDFSCELSDYMLYLQRHDCMVSTLEIERVADRFIKEALHAGCNHVALANIFQSIDRTTGIRAEFMYMLGDACLHAQRCKDAFDCYYCVHKKNALPKILLDRLAIVAMYCNKNDIAQNLIVRGKLDPLRLFTQAVSFISQLRKLPVMLPWLAARVVEKTRERVLDHNHACSMLCCALAILNKTVELTNTAHGFIAAYPEQQWIFRARVVASFCVLEQASLGRDLFVNCAHIPAATPDEYFYRAVFFLLNLQFSETELSLMELYGCDRGYFADPATANDVFRRFWFYIFATVAHDDAMQHKLAASLSRDSFCFEYFCEMVDRVVGLNQNHPRVKIPRFYGWNEDCV